MQFEVMKHVALALGRKVEAPLQAEVGAKVRVAYEYSADLKKAPGAVSIVYAGMKQRAGNPDRGYERDSKGGERFRNAPLLLKGCYLITAWAPAPDDLGLLGLVLRTFHDDPELELEDTVVEYDENNPALHLVPLSLEEHRAIAEPLGMPIAPSICVWVEFMIQSALTTPIKRVRERVVDFKKIDG